MALLQQHQGGVAADEPGTAGQRTRRPCLQPLDLLILDQFCWRLANPLWRGPITMATAGRTSGYRNNVIRTSSERSARRVRSAPASQPADAVGGTDGDHEAIADSPVSQQNDGAGQVGFAQPARPSIAGELVRRRWRTLGSRSTRCSEDQSQLEVEGHNAGSVSRPRRKPAFCSARTNWTRWCTACCV